MILSVSLLALFVHKQYFVRAFCSITYLRFAAFIISCFNWGRNIVFFCDLTLATHTSESIVIVGPAIARGCRGTPATLSFENWTSTEHHWCLGRSRVPVQVAGRVHTSVCELIFLFGHAYTRHLGGWCLAKPLFLSLLVRLCVDMLDKQWQDH